MREGLIGRYPLILKCRFRAERLRIACADERQEGPDYRPAAASFDGVKNAKGEGIGQNRASISNSWRGFGAEISCDGKRTVYRCRIASSIRGGVCCNELPYRASFYVGFGKE